MIFHAGIVFPKLVSDPMDVLRLGLAFANPLQISGLCTSTSLKNKPFSLITLKKAHHAPAFVLLDRSRQKPSISEAPPLHSQASFNS